MLDYFPDEIRHDILFRLPIKCLIRCTSVSKPWLSIIRNSSFIRSHLSWKINASNQHGTQLLLHGGRHQMSRIEPVEGSHERLFRHVVKDMYSLHYDNRDFDECCQIDFQLNRLVNPANEHFRVAGICDGLVCLADDLLCKMFNYIIWNPSIRKAVTLPWPGVTFTTHGAFKDSIGFGFDAITTDYKVVRLVTLENFEIEDEENPTVAEVYSLATGSWSSLGSVAPPCHILGTRPYTFFNGAIHWTVRHWQNAGANHYFILTFDLGSESFREIMMPKGTESHSESEVFVSGDGKSLALFTWYKDENANNFRDIWVMKEYCQQESWTKLITLGPQDPKGCFGHPLCFRKSGEVILVLGDSGWQSLFSLDTVSKKLTSIGCKYEYCSIHYYEESLVLLDMDNAVSC